MTIKQSVLIVEDEEDIRELVSYHVLKEGYQVAAVATGEEALQIARSQPPDLIVLDLMLPGIDGLTVCRELKGDAQTASIVVIMLTAKGEESDIVTGLNMGAADYITKPFSPKVLVARIRTALRNPAPQPVAESEDDMIKLHNMVIHVGRHEVLVDGEPVELSSMEFRILRLLAGHPGWVFTRQQILEGIHGKDCETTDRAVDVQVVGLRRRLGGAGQYIETVRSVGYRFKE